MGGHIQRTGEAGYLGAFSLIGWTERCGNGVPSLATTSAIVSSKVCLRRRSLAAFPRKRGSNPRLQYLDTSCPIGPRIACSSDIRGLIQLWASVSWIRLVYTATHQGFAGGHYGGSGLDCLRGVVIRGV